MRRARFPKSCRLRPNKALQLAAGVRGVPPGQPVRRRIGGRTRRRRPDGGKVGHGRRQLSADPLGGEGVRARIVHTPEDRMSHRAPWECTFAKEQRSRCLPGKRPRTDHEYFEVLSLCILQAGLSWASVRRSWARYRSAFLNFEVAKLAHAAPAALLRRPGALRIGRRSRLSLRMRRSSSASAQSMARSRATFARSNRKRMRARFCRSASDTWVRTPRSSTCTAWGGPHTVPKRRRLTRRCS